MILTFLRHKNSEEKHIGQTAQLICSSLHQGIRLPLAQQGALCNLEPFCPRGSTKGQIEQGLNTQPYSTLCLYVCPMQHERALITAQGLFSVPETASCHNEGRSRSAMESIQADSGNMCCTGTLKFENHIVIYFIQVAFV